MIENDGLTTAERRGDMETKCPWCDEIATAGVWTPRHGWIDLCQSHYNETSREVIVHLLQTLQEA